LFFSGSKISVASNQSRPWRQIDAVVLSRTINTCVRAATSDN
jgi:hypothetical protein